MTAVAVETDTIFDQAADRVLELSRQVPRGNVDYTTDSVIAELELVASHLRSRSLGEAFAVLGRLQRWEPLWDERRGGNLIAEGTKIVEQVSATVDAA